MKYIKIPDAIETTWMILRGLGYREQENPELVGDVKAVFDSAPFTDLRSAETLLNGKCGSCRFFEYEYDGSKCGFCHGKYEGRGRRYRTTKCVAYQPKQEADHEC